MIVCPCCGGSGTLILDPPVPLSRQQYTIYDYVRRAKYGIDWERLCDLVYAEDRDGGPDDPGNTVRLQIWRINRKLAGTGLKITSSSRGRGSLYSLKREDGAWM